MKNYIFITILLAIFFGLMAGLAGQIISRYYFSDDLDRFSLTREFNLLEGRSNLIIRDPRKVVVSQDAKIEETKEVINNSFFKLYNLDLVSTDYLFLDKPLALAMAISSDGWMMAILEDNLESYSQEEILENFKIICHDRSIYSLSEFKFFEKNDLNLLFFKLENLNNLKVLNTVEMSKLQSAQSLLAYKGENKVALASLIDHGFKNEVFSSDSFNRELSVKTQEYFNNNSFIFDLSGDFVGYIDSQSQFHPVLVLEMYWRSFLSDEEIKEVFLGIHYLNLSHVKFLENNYNRGAMIYASSSFSAFLENSPAYNSGLLEGDLISEVNGLELNDNLDLSEYILGLNPGDEILINYYRQGQKDQVEIILEEK